MPPNRPQPALHIWRQQQGGPVCQLETGLKSLQRTLFHRFRAAPGPATVGTGAASLLRKKLQVPVLLALLNAPLPLAGHSLNMFSPISTAAGGYCGPFCSCILQRGRHMCKALAGPHFAEHGPKFSIFAAGESPLPGFRLVGPASRRAQGKAAGSSRSLHRSATQPRRGQTRHIGAPIAPISAAPSLPSPCTLISRTT